MKKIFAIFLLWIFLFNTMGYFFVFRCNQLYIQSEIRGMIRSGYFKNNYDVVRIKDPESNPDFKRLDKNEFRYQGRLYDIIREDVRTGYTLFFCINDKQEEKLIAGLERSVQMDPGLGSPSRAKHTQAMIHHLITIALIHIPTGFGPIQSIQVCFFTYSDNIQSGFGKTFSPPPEIA